MTTIQSLIADTITEVVEFVDDHPDLPDDDRHLRVTELIRNNVPTMTTTLFQLVVEHNPLAFEDVDTETETTPFNILFEAVAQRIGAAVDEHLASREDDD